MSLERSGEVYVFGGEVALVRIVTCRRLGIRGLYSGLGFTMFRAIPTNAILFVSYEYVACLLRQFF